MPSRKISRCKGPEVRRQVIQGTEELVLLEQADGEGSRRGSGEVGRGQSHWLCWKIWILNNCNKGKSLNSIRQKK